MCLSHARRGLVPHGACPFGKSQLATSHGHPQAIPRDHNPVQRDRPIGFTYTFARILRVHWN